VADNYSCSHKLTDCAPKSEAQASSLVASFGLAALDKPVDDAPHRHWSVAVLAQGGHDLRGERMLNAP
jgi:hypothetical protein